MSLKLIRGGKGKLARQAEAAAWITRLHGPSRTPEMEVGFRRWLAEMPENFREFESLNDIWNLVGDLQMQQVPRTSGFARSVSPVWPQAAAILIACGLMIFGAYRLWAGPYYSTDIGEQRIVLLDDGTRVTLNSNTRLRSAYRDGERRVEIQRGEVFFEVVHDSTRPFRVVAGEHRVTALGTTFVVRYELDRTAVTLVEGKVVVDRISASNGPAGMARVLPNTNSAENARENVTLNPGERLLLNATRFEQIDRPPVDTLTAWRRGEVVLNNTPLKEAIAEMNRYSKTPIIVDGSSIGALTVSGLYHTGDSEEFSAAVARLHGLEVYERGESIHLKSR